ncbi:hypothetical protein PAMP_016719 [Pampus punctatissimus]
MKRVTFEPANTDKQQEEVENHYRLMTRLGSLTTERHFRSSVCESNDGYRRLVAIKQNTG